MYRILTGGRIPCGLFKLLDNHLYSQSRILKDDGRLEENQSNVDQSDDRGQGPVETVRGVVREGKGDRESGEYTYQVVYSQKSLRVLDLRLHSDAGLDVTDLRELLDTAAFAVGLAIANREIKRLND